jgi:late competence protein required for DNA uptake (superfamily II DNA/RNA helicase)
MDRREGLTCNRCGKKLSRKTARQIGSEIMCSACLFAPPKREDHLGFITITPGGFVVGTAL